jgi:hypothetical protein
MADEWLKNQKKIQRVTCHKGPEAGFIRTQYDLHFSDVK